MASYGGTIVVWDVEKQKGKNLFYWVIFHLVVSNFKEHLSACNCISSQDTGGIGGYLIASGSVDTKVKLWDLR